METETIAVRLLGGFSISAGDRALNSLPPQAVSLLAYLVIHRQRPQTRDLLAGRFWSELPEDRARKRLSNCLWQIKSGLGEAGLPELVVANSSTIELSPEHSIEVDAERFEAELSACERELRDRQVRRPLADRLAEVVSSYPGDFLSGHYHEWIEPVRERIRDRYHGALTLLIGLYKSRSQYEVALRFAHELVKQEPLREDLHREVMRIHALLDQAPAAERQFESLRQTLLDELGVEPAEETVALIERIRTDAPATSLNYRDEGRGTALIGRSNEMSVLLGRVDELLGGVGGVVLVEGPPGIGKTRLIHELIQAAEWRGVRVLQAGHTELSRMRPYEALSQVLTPAVTGLRGEHLAEVVEPVWLRAASEVLPAVGRLVEGGATSRPLRPEEEPARVSEALARIVLAQGGLGPSMIVLDDVHWADDDSMQVLVQLGGRLARSGVLLCLTYRRFEAEQADSVWSGIGQLEALPSGSRLVVGPLNPVQVRELVSSHLGPGGLPPAAMAQVVDFAGGNPLYVLESMRDPAGLIPDPEDEVDDLAPTRLPSAFVRSLESRLATLEPGTRGVLEALAALAEPASSTMVAAITGDERLPTVEALAATATLGFVVDDEAGECRFVHELTRHLVYETMPSDRRRDLHDRIVEALDDDEPSPARLAHHSRLAGRMATSRHWYLVAAREALEINAYRTAVDHFGQADEAARELGIDLRDRAEDLLAYEAALDVLGRRTDQTLLLKELREVDLPTDLALVLAERETWLLVNTDEPDEAVRVARRSLGLAGEAGLPVVGLLTAIAVARYRAGDLSGALDTASETLGEAAAGSERIAVETVLGKALVDLMRHEEGLAQLRRAAEEAERIGDERGRVEALNYAAGAEFGLGRYEVAERTLTEALEISRSIGYRLGEGLNLINLAALHTAQGHGGQALELFNGAGDILGSLGYGRVEAIVKHNLAELNHSLLGDDDAASSLASSAAVYFRSVGDQPNESRAMALLSSIDRRHGRRRLARRRLNDLLHRSETRGDTQVEVEVRRVLAALERDVGDLAAAAAHLDRIRTIGEQYPLDNVVANVEAKSALVALERNDRAKAETGVERALELNVAGADAAHVTASICGTVLAGLDRHEEAVEQFGLAYEMLQASLQGLPPGIPEQSRTVIPEHVQIVEQYGRHFATTVRAAVPLASAPLGRPLRADELVDVTWTVSAPEDWTTEDSAAGRRRRRLIRLVGEAEAQHASARVADLAEALGVSERTIKRDLAELRDRGVNLKTRRPM